MSTSAALRCINGEIASLRSELEKAAARDDLQYLRQNVITISQKIFSLTNHLGILLRSTNLRNSFEAYFSFEEMAIAIIGEADRLILSSEWDSIPFYIPSPPAALEGFVIIGIPAFASRNSLLLPLAAHELGHAVWRQKNLDSLLIRREAEKVFQAKINASERKFKSEFRLEDDLFSQGRRDNIVSECLKLVSSQCQEMFCDLLGASIFKESYVYAFDAFLTPGFGVREPSYPSFSSRAEYIIRAALPPPGDLRTGVLDLIEGGHKGAVDAIVRYADETTRDLEPFVLEHAKKFASLLPYENKQGENTEAIMANLRNGIPPNNPRSPVDILNAIWRVYFERLDLLDEVEDRSKLWTLMNNLCLKSLEIYEYRHGTKHARIAANNQGD